MTAAAAPWQAEGRAWSSAAARVLALAFVLRAVVFPFADNKHGDAPMRALIAERVVLEPGVAADPRTYCQFGPMHAWLMAPFVALDGNAARSSRYLSLLAGLLTFLPFLRLARRLVGAPGAELAGLALAASPLHVQASTTAASEALYLLLTVAMLERLVATLSAERGRLRDFFFAGLLACAGALTRYDAWLALPITLAAAWTFGRAPAGPARARATRGLALFAATAALAPAVWMTWGALRTDDPIFFFHYISKDHAQLAATALARFGAVAARTRQLGVWALAFAAAMTPPLAIAALLAAFGRARRAPDSPAMRVVLVAALAPPALYLAQGLLRLSFEPLPRFALVPGTLLLPFAAAAIPAARLSWARVGAPVAGVALAVAMFVVAHARPGRAWGGAESNGALTRLDAEDRALAAIVREGRGSDERVMIEPFDFADIAVTEAAGVPARQSITLAVTREPGATVADTMRVTGARWLAAYDDGRARGWVRRLPDWPRDAREVGRWRLIRR